MHRIKSAGCWKSTRNNDVLSCAPIELEAPAAATSGAATVVGSARALLVLALVHPRHR